MKLTLKCKSFRPFRRNTLFGFAEILVTEIGLCIKDVTIHEKNNSRWAGLPARPNLKDSAIVTDNDGKARYFAVLEFTSKEIRDAFSASVVRAVLEHTPNAFATEPTAKPNATTTSGFHDDQVPF
jgi:hypothetical protein